ncbi:hypothetical protein CF326_g3357 [Tilletia indica]|nr:hypothetical protein CF326_g3357 [Tilletia indica]
MADIPETPSRPQGARLSSTDPPDRGGEIGMLEMDSSKIHPVAKGFGTPLLIVGQARSRAQADFTPEQVQNKRANRSTANAEEDPSSAMTGTSAPQEPPASTRSTRQAAIQATERMAKASQATARGAGRRTSSGLGASFGITGVTPPANPSPLTHTSSADKEVGEDDEMEEDVTEVVTASTEDAPSGVKDFEVIAAVQRRQQQRTTDMAELCRVIDTACVSGAVLESGAELLRAALAVAFRHGELGPSGPPLAAALISNVRSYPVDKPQQYQRKIASVETRRETTAAAGQQKVSGPHAPPTQMHPARRWENLSGLRTLGGGKGSAQAVAAKGGMKARAVVVALTAGSLSHRMAAHERKEAVNMALAASEAPQHIRMLSSELNGMNLKIKPALNCSLGELFQYRDVIRSALDAEEVHDSKQWVRYKVMFVPERCAGLELTTSIIRADIEESIGGKLVRDPHRLRHGDDEGDVDWHHVQFAVLEEDKIKRPRVVGIAGIEYQVTAFVDKRRKPPCSQCLGFHKPFAAGCRNPTRCEHCGSSEHGTMEHSCKSCSGYEARSCPPVCPNCSGPHRFDDHVCKMAPRMNKHTRCWLVPSPGQAKAVRNQGRIDHKQKLQELTDERKKSAAVSAAAVGNGRSDNGAESSLGGALSMSA